MAEDKKREYVEDMEAFYAIVLDIEKSCDKSLLASPGGQCLRFLLAIGLEIQSRVNGEDATGWTNALYIHGQELRFKSRRKIEIHKPQAPPPKPVSPWYRVLEILDENGLQRDVLSKRMNMKPDELEEAIEADALLDEKTARAMCRAVGGDAQTFINMSVVNERHKIQKQLDMLKAEIQAMTDVFGEFECESD